MLMTIITIMVTEFKKKKKKVRQMSGTSIIMENNLNRR